MLGIVFSNLTLQGDKLLYEFNFPFKMVGEYAQNELWHPLVDRFRTDEGARTQIILYWGAGPIAIRGPRK